MREFWGLVENPVLQQWGHVCAAAQAELGRRGELNGKTTQLRAELPAVVTGWQFLAASI